MARVKASGGLRTRDLDKTNDSGRERRIEEHDAVEEQPVDGEDDGEGFTVAPESAEEPESEDSAASPPPVRRGRPKGATKRPKPESTFSGAPVSKKDLYAALCEAGMNVKHLALTNNTTPTKILNAIAGIVNAVSELELSDAAE